MTVELHKHPLYDGLARHWQVYHDLYEGDHAVLSSPMYLWPHELETGLTEDARRIRLIREQRSQYFNLVEPVVSRLTSLFFRDEPTYDESVYQLFGDAFDDVDGNGQSLTTFVKEEVMRALLLYGRPIILTDSYEYKLRNLAEQRESNARPYFELLDPLCVKDWQRSQTGGLDFLRYEYDLVTPRASALDKPEMLRYSRVYQRAQGGVEVIKFRQDAKPGAGPSKSWERVDAKTLPGWNDLPIAAAEEASWIKDVAPLALKVFNLDSVLDNIHLFQAHQRVFLIGDLSDQQKRAVAEFTVGFLPAGSAVHTIEPAVTTSLEARRERTVMDLFKVAFDQSRSVAADSKQVEGEGTQREGKEQLLALVKSQTESLENLINEAIRDWAMFQGQSDFQGEIHLSPIDTIEDLNQQIALANAFRDDISQYPTWKKATLKKFASAQNLPNIDEILEEIEAKTVETQDPDAEGAMRDRLEAAVNG